MSRKNALGLSLVELMIAMAIGLVVVGAVLSFTLSSLTANSEYVQATRLSQELRNSMDFVSRELRRAGYDQNVGSYPARFSLAGAIANPSPFGRIFIKDVSPFVSLADVLNPDDPLTSINADINGCIIYAYDRSGGTSGTVDLARGEIRAIRLAVRNVDGLDVGVLEVAESASGVIPSCSGDPPIYTNYPPSRNTDSGWSALSDPRVLNITQFTLDTRGYIEQPNSTTSTPVIMREIGVGLRGQLRRSEDGAVTRGIHSTVKVRADCLEASVNCKLAPTGT